MVIRLLSRLIQKKLPCTMELHFKVTIVIHWDTLGGFSLFLHHMIWKNREKCKAKNEKNLSSGSSKIVKNKENAFLHLGWRVQLIDH